MKASSPLCIRCGAPKDGACLPCKRASAREYIARNKEKVRAKNNEWKEKNKEAYLAKRSEWYEANKEQISKKHAVYHLVNKEKINKASSDWRKNNPERCRVHAHDRRARVAEVGGCLSPDIFAKLYLLQKGRCACCGAKLTMSAHLDHIVPISSGGANEDSNMQLLTQKCNNQKHAKDPIAFMQEKGFLI